MIHKQWFWSSLSSCQRQAVFLSDSQSLATACPNGQAAPCKERTASLWPLSVRTEKGTDKNEVARSIFFSTILLCSKCIHLKFRRQMSAQMRLSAVSKRSGPTVFPLKSEPFIPSTGNFQGIIFHPCIVYHSNFTIISYKLWKCEQFEKKWEKRETMF